MKVVSEKLKTIGQALVELGEHIESLTLTAAKTEPAKKVAKKKAEAVPTEKAAEFSEDDLKRALVEYAKKESKEKAYKVLEKYGAQKVSGLKKADYGKVMAAVQ